jgi:hypothetical protein
VATPEQLELPTVFDSGAVASGTVLYADQGSVEAKWRSFTGLRTCSAGEKGDL